MKGVERMRVYPIKSSHKKRIIKWENVLLIPMLILAVSGIIKSSSSMIIQSIVIHSIIVFSYYYIIKTIRITIKEKGLIKSIHDFINFN